MNYVRCMQNQSYLEFSDKPRRDEILTLTIGRIYKALPLTSHEREHGWLRIVDDTGEDYLFPAAYFEPVAIDAITLAEISSAVTVHLSPLLRGVLQAEAAAANKSVSALLREWIDERLDLPVTA